MNNVTAIILLSIFTAHIHTVNYIISTGQYLSQNYNSAYACAAVPTVSLTLQSSYFTTIGKTPAYLASTDFFAVENSDGVKSTSGNTFASEISANNYTGLENGSYFRYGATTTLFTLKYSTVSFYEPVIATRNSALTGRNPKDSYRMQYSINVVKNSIAVNNASTADSSLNSISCLTVNMTNPCVYIIPTTVFQLTLPTTNYPPSSSATIDPLSAFNATTCNVTLNNQASSSKSCSVSGNVLSISGLVDSYLAATSLSLVVCNIRRSNASANSMKIEFINSNYANPNNIYASGMFGF